MNMAARTGRRRNEPSVDALPEFYNYRDEGCEVAPACLRCPLDHCKYDDPQAWQRQLVAARQSPALLLLSQGVGVREVASQTGFAIRTVHRLKAGLR